MSKRHDAIGIKQTIRLEWLEKTVNLLFAGLDGKSIRHELHALLSSCKGNGSTEERGDTSRTQAVNILMKIWIEPESERIALRNTALDLLHKHRQDAFLIHWAMISAAYPFWFNTALQTGRLLNLQDQVTQRQIIQRLMEQYGDRQTVSRSARHVIRSFVAWGTLKDSQCRGCYEKTPSQIATDQDVMVLLIEAALHAIPEGKVSLNVLLNSPSFFPFHVPSMTGELVARKAPRIELVRYGLDDELIRLR